MITRRHIIVTTPKSEMANAAAEAAECIRGGGGSYFRALGREPKEAGPGSLIFYVEDGYIRGCGVINRIEYERRDCLTTGRQWEGWMAWWPAMTWTWIRPIPMKGFRGWRYFDPPPDMQIVGGWLDPRPEIADLRKQPQVEGDHMPFFYDDDE